MDLFEPLIYVRTYLVQLLLRLQFSVEIERKTIQYTTLYHRIITF